MPPDDKERTADSSPAPPSAARAPVSRPSSPLPPRVEKALAEARASAERARAGSPSRSLGDGGRWLAAIPVTAALLAFLLLMPRAAPPEDIPLPQIDQRALAATASDDDRRAAAVIAKPLDDDIRAVGTALRTLNRELAGGARKEDLSAARLALQDATRNALGSDPARGFDALRSLRAVQLTAFLAEVERYEATGQRTAELDELGGGFVERMTAAGWTVGHKVILDEAERRATFKIVWSATLGVERMPELAATLDEERVLYTLYLRHPHPSEPERLSFELMRRNALTEADCARAISKESLVAEQWRAEKIKRLGAIDPDYPTAYALGVAYYRAGLYDQSREQFQIWRAKHPGGPLTLRATNHLAAALAAFGPS